MSYKAIANLIPIIQSASLVSHNLKVVNKKKNKTKDMIDLGVTNIVGTSMIKINADLIGGL
jgi:hypothetical protein